MKRKIKQQQTKRRTQQREGFAMQKSKYGNKKIVVGDMTFDSRKEYDRYQQLLLLQKVGTISQLKHQVRFELVQGVKFAHEQRKKPAICYWADFTYIKDGVLIVEDVKSEITRKDGVYRLKKHLMMAILNIEIVEI